VSLEYGARELKRTVYRSLTQPLATLVAENGVPPASTVAVDVNASGEGLEFNVQGGSSPALATASPAVLIVDDNRSLLKFLKTVMSKEGWDLSVAGSAASALQLAEKCSFDIALIDYMLPDLDGAALSMKLKAQIPNLEIVLMTGGGAMAFPPQSALANVPILQKPFLIDDVLQLIRSKLPKKTSVSSR
jgi:CheY-like chemotaxis protein